MCVDVKTERVESVNQGIIPIYELGFTPHWTNRVEAWLLRLTTDPAFSDEHGLMLFVLATPVDEDVSAELKYVFAVANIIASKVPGILYTLAAVMLVLASLKMCRHYSNLRAI